MSIDNETIKDIGRTPKENGGHNLRTKDLRGKREKEPDEKHLVF